MSVYETLIHLIGQPPPGYEIIVWVVGAVTFLFMLNCAYTIVSSVFKWISGGRGR